MDILVICASSSVVTQTLEKAVKVNVTVKRFIATLRMVVKVHFFLLFDTWFFFQIHNIILKIE